MIKILFTHLSAAFVISVLFIPLFVQVNTSGLTLTESTVYAQSGGGSGTGTCPPCAPNTLCNPLRMCDLVSVIVAIADILLILAVPIIIIFIVYAGFLYVTAQGNATKIKDAHNALLYALIGGAIILGAKVISAIVANTVNSITVP